MMAHVSNNFSDVTDGFLEYKQQEVAVDNKM